MNIKTSVVYAMAQAPSEAAKVGSISTTLTFNVTTVAGGFLDSMHHTMNMGYQNIGVLQHTFTGICNVVRTLEQKMNNLSQNGTSHSIKFSSTSAPRDNLEVRLSTLTSELDGLWHLT